MSLEGTQLGWCAVLAPSIVRLTVPEAGAAAASDQSLMCTGCPDTVGNQTRDSWVWETIIGATPVLGGDRHGKEKETLGQAWETHGGRQRGGGVLGCRVSLCFSGTP